MVGRRKIIQEQIEIFKHFCESTSLHGYSYLLHANSILLKSLWAIVIIVMTAIGIRFCVVNTLEYLGSGLVTTIESSTTPIKVNTTIRELSFPTRYIFLGDCFPFSNCLQSEPN